MRLPIFTRKVGFTLLLLFSCAAAQSQPRYTLTDLSSYAFAPGVSYGVAINDAGQVAGSIFADDGRSSAFLYTPGAGMLNIGLFPPAGANPSGKIEVYAAALNNAGQVTGSWTDGAYSKPFLYSAATGMVDLGGLSPGPFQNGGGRSVNDSGTVLGYSFDTSVFSYRTFLYDATNGLRDLGTPLLTSDGGAINNAGTIAGTANLHATTYDRGGLHDLGTLGGGTSFAKAINNAGEVVGYSAVDLPGDSALHAFLYNARTGMADLNSLGGLAPNYYSVATAINDRGQVAGYFGTAVEGESSAFLFDSAFGLMDLNDLVDPVSAAGWRLDIALGINDAGQIVGYGLLDGNPRGFLLSALPPVPEPSTWALMLLGLAGLGLRRQARLAILYSVGAVGQVNRLVQQSLDSKRHCLVGANDETDQDRARSLRRGCPELRSKRLRRSASALSIRTLPPLLPALGEPWDSGALDNRGARSHCRAARARHSLRLIAIHAPA